jgi:ferrous iron transport protein B
VPPRVVEARQRYAQSRRVLDKVETRAPVLTRWHSRVAGWLHRPVPATLTFFAVMALVFQAVFAWATPFMDLIDGATVAVGGWLGEVLPPGMLASLLIDGVIAGVGSVLIFLPQIMILFLFIIVLEDTGYLARAAFLSDRL